MSVIKIDAVISQIKRIVRKHLLKRSSISMWKKRARQYGVRAALNIGHPEFEVDSVTQMQKDIIFPLVRKELLGNEELVLDLGCGPGRFTPDLANMISGHAIGIDPVEYFIEIAPKGENVSYEIMKRNKIAAASKSIDIVWICLVLGGIAKDEDLKSLINEISRVLRENGLIVLVENTENTADGDYWRFRSVNDYINLFNFAKLEHKTDYYDLGQRISIMIGRVF
jgi:ubiquinone/menaquinone biosynthesis C-methylase UbiE